MTEQDASLLKMIYDAWHDHEDRCQLHWSFSRTISDNPFLVESGIMRVEHHNGLQMILIADWDAFRMLIEMMEM